jgi:DNA polymerase delta subunit 1
MGRTIEFRASYWHFEEKDVDEEGTKELLIHIGGLTSDNKSVHCVVEKFAPLVYLELPPNKGWNKFKCEKIYEYFRHVKKSSGPVYMSLEQKYKLRGKVLVNTMCLGFPTNKACYDFAYHCTRNQSEIGGVVGLIKKGEFKVHEHNIDPVLKFTAMQDIRLSGWIKAVETIPKDSKSVDDRKFTTADIDLRAVWSDVTALPEKKYSSTIVKPKYASFDIECYSKNHNSKLPDPTIPENEIFQVATITGYLGDKGCKKYLHTLYNPHDIPDVKVIRCSSEKELLLLWSKMIRSEDPDIFVGYNIMKFDWNYMIARAELLECYPRFAMMSRIIGQKAELRKMSWSSSAYGEQEFRFLDAHGRVNVDVLLEIERNYRFPKYTLDYVSEFFLKKHKEDITPRQLFMLVKFTKELTSSIENLTDDLVPKKARLEIKQHVKKVFPIRMCHGDVKQLRQDMLKANTGKDFKHLLRRALTLTGTYCVQDTLLPIELMVKLNLWPTMQELSNCMNVPSSYLHTRGQQIKVLAQVYRETMRENIIIPYRNKEEKSAIKFQGAVVIEANPGYYRNVNCFDFASLYPSMIIAYNIDYTTLLPDDDPTPDEECNILAWSEHLACVHDPLKRKRKAEDVLCQEHRYRFLKVVTLPSGERLNEGLLPRLERRLMSKRKDVRKEMGVLEARLKMATGQATEKDIKNYKKWKYNIIEKGALTEKQIEILVITVKILNAQQLALKISCNSMYGTLGAQTGFIPLVEGAASVTAMGRKTILTAIDFIRKRYSNSKLVYGDTDSAMVTFEDLNEKQSFEMGDKVSKETSHYLRCLLMNIPEDYSVKCPKDGVSYRIDKYPRDFIKFLSKNEKIKILEYDSNPITLQFENLYSRYLLLSKKRYICFVANREGRVAGKSAKGVCMVRRDNSRYLRDTYKILTDGILNEADEDEFMRVLYERVNMLFTKQIPDTHLIIYTGVKSVQQYAKKKEIKQGKQIVERKYIDDEGNVIENLSGVLDPRLVYPNIPQCMLALKMIARGDDVPPNTRLEYLYLEDDTAVYQGQKAEDYTFYKENKDVMDMRPDYLHYIEKQLKEPITELINVRFPRRVVVPHEDLEDRIQELVRCMDNELLRFRIVNVKKYEKTYSDTLARRDGVVCGWGAKKIKPKYKRPETRGYSFTRFAAQVQHIIDSSIKRRRNPKLSNEIDEKKYPELVSLCLRWKSREIVNKLHSQVGMRKRTAKRPAQTGEKLRIATKDGECSVVLARCVKKYPRLTVCRLKAIYEEDVVGDKNKKRYFYDLETPTKEILNRVPRNHITTFRYKDSTVLKDILTARTGHKEMIASLNNLFERA